MTYIPFVFEPGSKLKSKLPKVFHPLLGEAYRVIRRIIIPIRNKRLQKKLSPLEFRSLHARGSNQLKILPDDTVRVPFLLSGWKIKPKNNIVSQQIRSVDIIPTLTELISVPFDESQVEGKSVLPLINGSSMPESIAFIEIDDIRGNFLKLADILSNYQSDQDAIATQDEAILNKAAQLYKGTKFSDHPKMRPVEAAVAATQKAIDLAVKYNKRLHVSHIPQFQQHAGIK